MSLPLAKVLVRDETGEVLFSANLAGGVHAVGSSSRCAVRIQVAGVEPDHLNLEVSESGVCIQAPKKGCALWLDGWEVDGRTLVLPGQQIRIGGVVLEVREAGLGESGLAEGKLEVLKEIARGGMGTVYHAWERIAEREVAVKILKGGQAEPVNRGRFITEAKVTAQLEHPGVVPVYDLGAGEAGETYYTMKLVQGKTLLQVLEGIAAGEEGMAVRYPLAVLLGAFVKVCDAIAFAHSRGVIHRDLKPENIMLGEYGEVLLMDWGVAKSLPGNELGTGMVDLSGNSILTMAGEVVGTPHYMSPEQAMGKNELVGPQSDVYSLGAILHQILTLRLSVEPGAVMDVLRRVASGEILPLVPLAGLRTSHLPGGRIPSSLVPVVKKAMALQQSDRYRSVQELQSDVERFQQGFPTLAERSTPLRQAMLMLRRHQASALAAVLMSVIGIFFGLHSYLSGRQANQILGRLRDTAVSLKEVAEADAEFQRLEVALKKLDTADALAPGHLSSSGRRAWMLAGLGRLGEAAEEMKRASKGDRWAEQSEKWIAFFAALSGEPLENWKMEDRANLLEEFERRRLGGEALSLTNLLRASGTARVELVRAALRQRDSEELFAVSQDKLGYVSVRSKGWVSSLEPLRGLPISELILTLRQDGNLSYLEGLPLRTLRIRGMPHLKTLDVLKGLPLRELDLMCRVGDCRALSGMPLRKLNLGNGSSIDLQVLASAPIEHLGLRGVQVRDLTPLAGKPLRYLDLSNSGVTDLSPLKQSPLRNLDISGCDALASAGSLDPLTKMPDLTWVMLPKGATPPSLLRYHPALRRIGRGGMAGASLMPAEAFWAAYDKQQGSKK